LAYRAGVRRAFRLVLILLAWLFSDHLGRSNPLHVTFRFSIDEAQNRSLKRIDPGDCRWAGEGRLFSLLPFAIFHESTEQIFPDCANPCTRFDPSALLTFAIILDANCFTSAIACEIGALAT
jgi:hypothetical protein